MFKSQWFKLVPMGKNLEFFENFPGQEKNLVPIARAK